MKRPAFRSCVAWTCLVLPLLLFPLCTAIHIWSFSFGADPRMFLSLANGLAHGHPFSEVTRFVVPGWPLFLAAGFRLIGPFAACTSNVLLFLLLLLLLARFLGDLLRSPARGVLTALVCLLFLFGGYPQNPHYLLFPYRQTPFYLPTLLALYAAHRAAANQTAHPARSLRAAFWIFLSLTAVAVATAVRETSPIVLPSLFAFFLLSPLPDNPLHPSPPRLRLRLLAILTGFCLLGALAVLALVLTMPGRFSNMQTEFLLTWLRRFLAQPLADLPLWRILSSLAEEYGWLGLLLLALGLVRACFRPCRPFLFLFVLPALTYLLFDGLFKSNPRYVLSTLFFSAPIAALGVDGLVSLAAAAIARHPRLAAALRPPALEAMLALLLLPVAFAKVLPSIHVGNRVTRAQIEHMFALLRPHASETRPVVLDARHDVLLDILPVFSTWPTLRISGAEQPGDVLASPPLPFIQSLSRRAVRATTVAPDAIAVLEGIAELRLVPNGTFELGTVPFDLVLLDSPTNSTLALPLPPAPVSHRMPPPPVTFLRLSAPIAAATNPIVATLGGHLLASILAPGRAFLPVSSAFLTEGEPDHRVLSLSAHSPFPSAFHPEWLSPDAPVSIRFGPMVVPSTDHFLSPEFLEFNDTPVYDKVYPSWPLKPYAREFARPGVITLPPFPSIDRPVPAILSIEVSALHHEPESHLFATVSFPEFPGVPPMQASLPHSNQPQIFTLRLPPLPTVPSKIALALSRDIKAPIESFPNRRRFNSRLHSVSMLPLWPADSLTLDFTSPDDGALLDKGFYPQEGLGSRNAGRWIAPSASLVLPPRASLPPSGAVRISLVADMAMRPADDSMAVAFSLPDTPPCPAVREPIPGTSLARFSADIPVTSFSKEFPADLQISVQPAFSPAALGSKDSRSLGLFLKSFSVQPSEPE